MSSAFFGISSTTLWQAGFEFRRASTARLAQALKHSAGGVEVDRLRSLTLFDLLFDEEKFEVLPCGWSGPAEARLSVCAESGTTIDVAQSAWTAKPNSCLRTTNQGAVCSTAHSRAW